MLSNDHERHVMNGLAHFDIAGPDLQALSGFYSAVFGWSVDAQGPGYALVRTPRGSADGALVERESASLTIGIVVPDLAQAVAAAEGCGGRLAMEPTANGWVTKAQISDPAGNIVTLIQG